jgi:hypothetical protein
VTAPVPPTGVVVRHGDGSTTDAEVEFIGYEDGIAQWMVLPVPNLLNGDRITIGVLPPKTAIRFAMQLPEKENE